MGALAVMVNWPYRRFGRQDKRTRQIERREDVVNALKAITSYLAGKSDQECEWRRERKPDAHCERYERIVTMP